MDQPWATADVQYTETDDGLTKDWMLVDHYGLWRPFIWCNPPFGPHAGTWLDRMAQHHHGIALVPARTETAWFIRAVWDHADAVLFLHGRPHFHYPDGTRGKANSGVPITLVGYGETAVWRLRRSKLPGSLVCSWETVQSEPASDQS